VSIIDGPSLSYSDMSLNLEPLAFSKPLGSPVDVAECEAKDALFEMEERQQVGENEGGGPREGRRSTLDHGGVHVKVEVQRTVSSWSG
jgi:hypothetical protein